MEITLGNCVVRSWRESDAESITRHAFATHELNRIYAMPYEWNQASFRVLEKSGYVLEGRLRRAAYKDGQVIDQLLYAVTREDLSD